MFGNFIRTKRLENNMTLRNFCRSLNDEDFGNWSKVERKLISPPQNFDKLQKIAGILNIKEGSEDWEKLFDYSKIDAGHLPDFVTEEPNVLEILPIFLRTVKNVKPNREELLMFIEDLKKL